jgi:succinyl-diaminopimelate desuccinylase
MKSAIAAFVAATSRYLSEKGGAPDGSLSFLITGDEEGPAVNGTVKVLEWLKDRGETIDFCLVGEPTNPEEMGQMIKVGRRGSLHGIVKVNGTQGHVAYPHKAHNPIPDLVKVLAELNKEPLDSGNDRFQPSNLEVVNIDVGNDSHNVIPAEAKARFNVRFNNEFTPEELKAELTRRMARAETDYEIDWWLSGDSFLTPEGPLSDAVAAAVEKHTGRRPELSTTGGTSDARFIKNMCPVVEFGLVGATMHKIDEHVAVADIETLTEIYKSVIESLLKA